MIVTATVTHFVLFVDVQMWAVFLPTTSYVHFAFIKKQTGVWSMLMTKRRLQLLSLMMGRMNRMKSKALL